MPLSCGDRESVSRGKARHLFNFAHFGRFIALSAATKNRASFAHQPLSNVSVTSRRPRSSGSVLTSNPSSRHIFSMTVFSWRICPDIRFMPKDQPSPRCFFERFDRIALVKRSEWRRNGQRTRSGFIDGMTPRAVCLRIGLASSDVRRSMAWDSRSQRADDNHRHNCSAYGSRLISGLSYKTACNNELWTSIFPL
jgi:hypothetical protein